MISKYELLKMDRYERFVYALNQCGRFLVNANNKVIETCIFEDFDIGVRGDISDENLDIFIEEGWINEEIRGKCILLRKMFLNISENQPILWNPQAVKTSKEWLEILNLSDEIKMLLYY